MRTKTHIVNGQFAVRVSDVPGRTVKEEVMNVKRILGTDCLAADGAVKDFSAQATAYCRDAKRKNLQCV